MYSSSDSAKKNLFFILSCPVQSSLAARPYCPHIDSRSFTRRVIYDPDTFIGTWNGSITTTLIRGSVVWKSRAFYVNLSDLVDDPYLSLTSMSHQPWILQWLSRTNMYVELRHNAPPQHHNYCSTTVYKLPNYVCMYYDKMSRGAKFSLDSHKSWRLSSLFPIAYHPDFH